MATVRARNHRWEAQVRRRGWPTQTRTFRTRREAEAWAAAVESELARGVMRDRRRCERTLFAELLTRYRNEITPDKKGVVAERARLNALLRSPLARMSLDRLDSAQIASWRNHRLAQVTGSTVNRELNLISAVINTARKDWGLQLENPVELTRRPKENRARRRRLTGNEEARLLAALEPNERGVDGTFLAGGTRNPWLKPLVVLALKTAMRRSELLALRWQDVFLAERYARLHDSKNGEPRDVPLSSRAVATLASLPRAPGGTPVFPTSAEAVKQGFERAVERACIEDLRFHDLRHKATSRIACRLSNVLELSAVTGHKTLRMLARYYHPRATDLALKLG